jgi:hypothetical protein
LVEKQGAGDVGGNGASVGVCNGNLELGDGNCKKKGWKP